ncbi:MAG: hypothetical protein ABI293_09970 [Rhodanobacter sp.]
MLQFIPFEDDWDALESLRPEDLIPYRVGLLPAPLSLAIPSIPHAVQGRPQGQDAGSVAASAAA